MHDCTPEIVVSRTATCVGSAAAHVRLTYGVFDPVQDETLAVVIHPPSRAADRVSDARSPESRDLGLILLSCLRFPGVSSGCELKYVYGVY